MALSLSVTGSVLRFLQADHCRITSIDTRAVNQAIFPRRTEPLMADTWAGMWALHLTGSRPTSDVLNDSTGIQVRERQFRQD